MARPSSGRVVRRRTAGAERYLPRVEQLILARHGESDYNVQGLVNGDPVRRCQLTPTGRMQARRLGTFLRNESIDLCVTSEFERTKETAEIALAQQRAVPRLVIPELNDHSAGDFEGRGMAQYLDWAHAASSDELIPGAAESRLDAVHRFVRGYRILLEHPEPTIAAIVHSLPISYLLSGPFRRQPFVDYAAPAIVSAAKVLAGVERLESWATSPTW
jgi:broad specificity phosphatase PhoE